MPVKLSSIKPNPSNPRLIKDDRFKKLVKSIQEFPKMMELRPMVIDKTRVIIGGNMRLKALQELGYKDIPDNWIKKAEDLTEDERSRFIVADNVSFGENDWDILSTQFDINTLEDWGLDIPDFARPDQETQEDEYEIPDDIQTDIIAGDLFDIGPHRLICGDSTVKSDVDKLLAWAVPILMVTDPPYGVNYDPGWRKENNETKGFAAKTVQTGKVTNDDNARWGAAYDLFKGDVIYIWCASQRSADVHMDIVNAGFTIYYQIIWNKQFGVFGRGDYHWQHEPCWYAVRKGKKHNWCGDRKQTTVWDIKGFNPNGNNLQATEKKTGHGTQKPVECMGRPIRNNTKEGNSVYDPFIGSGTTMIAAHQLNRICYGIEIDPKYCQIIVNRMLALDPNLVIKKNGVLLENAGNKSA